MKPKFLSNIQHGEVCNGGVNTVCGGVPTKSTTFSGVHVILFRSLLTCMFAAGAAEAVLAGIYCYFANSKAQKPSWSF